MRKFKSRGLLAVMMLAAAGLRSPAVAEPAAAPRPNVLLIVTDDQRWDTIAALGNQEIRTPNLDALVGRGFVFRNAYCMGSMVGAVCAPSRTMLLTGRSLWRIPDPAAPRWDHATLPTVFRQAGYQTLYVGKRGNSFRLANEAFGTTLYDEDRPADANSRAGASAFHAATAIRWLDDQSADVPWLICLAPPVPHDPRQAPPEFHALYPPEKLTLSGNFLPEHPFDNGELRIRDELLAPHPRTADAMRQHLSDYYATITCLDEQVGRVIAALRDSGRWEQTLVVFTSDQGLAVGGRHGLMGKQNLYEHVKPPLVLAGPGIPQGSSEALVYLFDLLPTLCDYAQLPCPDGVEGQSLLPIVRGDRARIREWLLAAYGAGQRMVRDERWKLIAYDVAGQRPTQLFDLRNDPEELRNLADAPEHAAPRRRLEQALDQQRRAWGDPVAFRGDAVAQPPPASAAETARPDRPNILWLIAEDFGPHLGCYGTEQVWTPHLDRLAAEGVRYTRFFTTAPVCSASRSAFMTGMYQTTIGAHQHRSHRDDGFRLPEGVRLLPDWLRDAGYFPVNLRHLPKSCGFRGTAKTDWNFTTAGPGFDSDRWADLAGHQPFYAQLNFQETHRGFHAPRRADPQQVALPPYDPDHTVTRADRAAYLDAASELDRKVGLVLEALRADDLLESTIVVFFGDNGQAHVRGKQFCYDSGLHVPLLIRWPQRFPRPERFTAGTVDDRLLAAIDLAPTMLALAGAPAAPAMQGQAFLGPSAGPDRRYVFGARDRCDETVFRFRTVRDARYRYIRNFTPDRPFLQANDYKERSYPGWNLLKQLYAEGKLTPPQAALCAPRMPEEELYDLATDPHEIQNLVDSAEHRAELQRLRAALDRWIDESHDQGVELEPAELAARRGVTQEGTPPNRGYALEERPPRSTHSVK